MEKMANPANMGEAFKQVKKNKGAAVEYIKEGYTYLVDMDF